mmetsp:Transcript_46049/g.94205  ORF Transcript_46049/g.94205 Transcript_46049/m.94205 type:complete len:286 (-) Transcript_46049:266-1123(-)
MGAVAAPRMRSAISLALDICRDCCSSSWRTDVGTTTAAGVATWDLRRVGSHCCVREAGGRAPPPPASPPSASRGGFHSSNGSPFPTAADTLIWEAERISLDSTRACTSCVEGSSSPLCSFRSRSCSCHIRTSSCEGPSSTAFSSALRKSSSRASRLAMADCSQWETSARLSVGVAPSCCFCSLATIWNGRDAEMMSSTTAFGGRPVSNRAASLRRPRRVFMVCPRSSNSAIVIGSIDCSNFMSLRESSTPKPQQQKRKTTTEIGMTITKISRWRDVNMTPSVSPR